jgi:dipeptidyl aminopeptidase/acylaminoacyl peptidase
MPNPRPLTFDDFWRLRQISDVQLSPDGNSVAYGVAQFSPDDNKTRSAIWLGNLEDGTTRQLTAGEAADTQPAWSADGNRLAFVSTRHEGKPQIFVLDLQGGEPRRVTSTPDGAATPRWSPDGRSLCFTSAVPVDVQQVPQENAWVDGREKLADAPRMRRQSTLLSRFDGRGYVDRRTHLFLIDVDAPDAQARRLTEGEFDELDPAWSPDGRTIAFVSNRREDREYSLGGGDLWLLDVESGELTALTDGGLTMTGPAWSPDGRHITFYAAPEYRGCGYRQIHLYLVSRDGGDARDISAALDRGCGSGPLPDYIYPAPTPPAWSPDGHTIYFVVADRGDGAVYALDLSDGTLEFGDGTSGQAPPTPQRISQTYGHVASVQCARQGALLMGAAATPVHPFDVYCLSAEGGELTFPFDSHRDLLQSAVLSAPERITWSGPDGWEIEGWLMEPVEGTPDPYPLILHVHGGPHGMYGNTFYFQKQVLAGAGYGVLYTNPRGSGGYGHEFTSAADWGLKDYEDILAGVDAVLERGRADPNRLGVTGISYGGFMTNWIIGHTNRFAGAVSVNGVSNFVSFFGVADIGPLWFDREFLGLFGSPFWRDAAGWQRYIERSPIAYVENIETPLLLLQSENDYRCPIDQGEQMLTALRYQGKTVELIRVPGASHVIFSTAAPHHRYLQWVLLKDWFDTYVKGSTQAEEEPEAEATAPVATNL